MYRVVIRKQAIKALKGMGSPEARRVRAGLDKLAQDPDRRDIDVMPLRGRPGFRLRIGGWRVIFDRHEEAREIDVLRIGPRGDVY